jgi:Family of unknown function (DUF6427)
MLSFFRVNAFYQIIILLALLLIIRLPIYLSGLPTLIPELQWMLTAEQMNRGLMLYTDIWDSTSPLAAMVYASIDFIFGRAQFIYMLVALAFSTFQFIYFNLLCNRLDVFPDRNYIPGLIYVLFLNISFDCFTLSPPLMATTFIMMAFGTLIQQMGRQGATDEVFEIGFYLSIATLFHPPILMFVFWAIVSMTLFTGASFRQHALNIFGFLLPMLLTTLYFYLDGHIGSFARNFVAPVFEIRQYNLNDFRTLILTLFFPVLVGVLGFFKVVNHGRYTNFQTRCQQIMALWFIAGILSIGLMPFIAPMQFIVFAPCITFFAVYFFTSFHKKWMSELLFIGLIALVLLFEYQGVYPSLQNGAVATLNNLRLKPAQLPSYIHKKRIILLGDGMSEYTNNYPATPYTNWKLARFDLENLDSYESVINILKNFEQDPPEYIIDRMNIVPRLFHRIPLLSRKYQQVEKGIYKKVA